MKMAEHVVKSLNEVPVGRRMRIRQLRGGKVFITRMTVLGFTEGAEIQVIQNFGHGPLITIVRGVRVALGRGEALKVLVQEVRHDMETSN